MMVPGHYHRNYILSDRGIWLPREEVDGFDVAGFLQQVRSPLPRAAQDANAIIKDACQRNEINPRWVLSTLQKEQSLVKQQATQKRLDWAMGYGCPDDGRHVQKFKGFKNQVDSACAAMRRYALPGDPLYCGSKVREVHVIDGEIVEPVNLATAACYQYTPHTAGNQSLWRLYNEWFGEEADPAKRFVEHARAQVGKPYHYGCEVRLDDPNPERFDCSELVQWALHQVGIDYTDGAHNQWLRSRRVEPTEAAGKTGGLLFRWGKRDGKERIVHVGIASGEGSVIEARGREYGVIERAVDVGVQRWTHGGLVTDLYA